MKKSFTENMTEINENIAYVKKLLKEAMSFCGEDEMGIESEIDETNPDVEEEFPMDDEGITPETSETVESYVDHIRKYSLNALSALADNPESEEYQMLKKIFQMCDKKPEKKEGMTESHRIFGVLKDNKRVIFETRIGNTKDFKNLKNTLIKETTKRGYNPSNVRLVAESKLIR
jgi:hypothetical protein